MFCNLSASSIAFSKASTLPSYDAACIASSIAFATAGITLPNTTIAAVIAAIAGKATEAAPPAAEIASVRVVEPSLTRDITAPNVSNCFFAAETIFIAFNNDVAPQPRDVSSVICTNTCPNPVFAKSNSKEPRDITPLAKSLLTTLLESSCHLASKFVT